MTQKSNQQKPPTTTKPLRFALFMKLPSEPRQMVYEFTLADNQQPVFVDRWNANHCVFRPPRTVSPELRKGLMVTCHQIGEEMGQKYYSLNEFRLIQLGNVLVKWLRDRNRRDRLRRVTCHLDSSNNSYEIIQLLRFCKTLVTLKITTQPDDIRMYKFFEKFRALHWFASAEAIAV